MQLFTKLAPDDFNFLVGKWKMHHRRLNKRLEGCKDWSLYWVASNRGVLDPPMVGSFEVRVV